VKLKAAPTVPFCVAGAVTVGALSTLFTVIAVEAEPERAFVAVNVAAKLPDCVKVGVQLNVPLVLPAPAANVAPPVTAVPVAVSEVMASASGSFAVTLTVRSEFSLTEAVAGAVTVGALSTLFTVIAVDAEPERAFAAVNVAAKLPACVNVGVQLKVPLVLPAPAANVAPAVTAVPVAVSEVMASASGSLAVTLTVRSEFSFTEAVAGAVTVGALSTLLTVIAVDAEPERLFVAVNVALKLPACVNVGVQLSVPVVLPAPAANVAPAVMAVPVAVSEAIAGPSASDADTLTVRSEFSFTEAVAGAVTTGAAPVPTVIAVDAEPERAFAAVNVAAKEPVEAGVQLSVPDVLPAPAANVAPAVMAVPVAVSEVIA
jgi:hypothetical protein